MTRVHKAWKGRAPRQGRGASPCPSQPQQWSWKRWKNVTGEPTAEGLWDRASGPSTAADFLLAFAGSVPLAALVLLSGGTGGLGRKGSPAHIPQLELTTRSLSGGCGDTRHCALLPGAVLLIMDYMLEVWKPTRNPKRRTHALGGERHK